jgi:TldD protein
MNSARAFNYFRVAAILVVSSSALLCGARPSAAQVNSASANIAVSNSVLAAQATAANSDPVLSAMLAELSRSKDQLKMENVARPYYIEYRVTDYEQLDDAAEFGALTLDEHLFVRVLRVVVRVGDYKQDSYFGQMGQGVSDSAPLENDAFALRHALWLATDNAYKSAGEALAAKQAMLKEVTPDQTVDDFAHAQPLVALDAVAKLDVDVPHVKHMVEAASALYNEDPEVQVLVASGHFTAVNEYFVNTEGSVTRRGQAVYQMYLGGSTQASDGMRLDRSPLIVVASPKELPTEAKFVASAQEVMRTLKQLRDAPVVEEEYRGPVLLSPDASDDVLATLIGDNAAAHKPAPGRNGRTTGAFASSYKSRVLPPFISVVDDPTQTTFHGQTLTGSYSFDEDGVRVAPLTIIDRGQLVNYLLGRQPISDFPNSNGHDRASAGGPPQPHFGVLTLQATENSTPAELKAKLLQMCKDQGKPYCYRIETFSGLNSPRLLYRVWTNDGHEELVRGALLNELDVRGLRNSLIAVGNDPLVSNRPGNIPATVISPSMLFVELEIRRDDRAKSKLPDYPPPPINGASGATKSGTER